MTHRTQKEFARTFVPETADMGDWTQIEPLFNQLLEREIRSPKELDQWLLDHSELAACLSEEHSRRYIAMTCHTDDPELEKNYLYFLENIDPKCKPYWHRLNEKYVACPHRKDMDSKRYRVLDRNIQAEIEIFREKNIPLQTEASKLSQKYQKLCGAMTVQFEGEERTLPQMAKYLEVTDRPVRREAWEQIWKRRLQDREEMDALFDRLVELRHTIARNADCSDFRMYAFKMYKRFDYTPDDCLRFHEAIERWVVPLMRKNVHRRAELMQLESLRPWDLAVDPKGRPPLRPFQSPDELCAGVERIFGRLDEELAKLFAEMKKNGELDLDSRKGKAPGGYLSCLDEIRRPFIFMNAAGLQRDVETLLHESGHAFHSLACRKEPLLAYRDAPIEFAEVASMSMELFGDDSLDVFYSKDDAARAKRMHLDGVLEVLPWIARIDAFQHWIYTHPTHSRKERIEYWLELDRRFGPVLNWESYPAAREALWQRQLHLFCHPFYYIEYGIAQLGALQLWSRFKNHPAQALRRYRSALALGGSRPLPSLFENAGAVFDFTETTIRPLVQQIEEELNSIPE